MPASPACSLRSSSSSWLRGSFFGAMRYWMLGRSKLATKCRALGEAQPLVAISRVGGARGGGGQRDARARRASARAARTARGSRAGSRGPTARRSAPRRWRTARSCRGRAAAAWTRPAAARARGRAGRARRRGTAASTVRRWSRSCVELRNPARTPSARSASTWSCISAISGETTTPDAGAHQRGDLVAQRLAAAGRHQHERVAAAADVLDDLGLLAAERVVAEDAVQCLQGLGLRVHHLRPARPVHRSVPRAGPSTASPFTLATIGVPADTPRVIHSPGRIPRPGLRRAAPGAGVRWGSAPDPVFTPPRPFPRPSGGSGAAFGCGPWVAGRAVPAPLAKVGAGPPGAFQPVRRLRTTAGPPLSGAG